jgi:hypothetical protein
MTSVLPIVTLQCSRIGSVSDSLRLGDLHPLSLSNSFSKDKVTSNREELLECVIVGQTSGYAIKCYIYELSGETHDKRMECTDTIVTYISSSVTTIR